MFKRKRMRELENRVFTLESKVTTVAAAVTVELDSSNVAENVEKYIDQSQERKSTRRR